MRQDVTRGPKRLSGSNFDAGMVSNGIYRDSVELVSATFSLVAVVWTKWTTTPGCSLTIFSFVRLLIGDDTWARHPLWLRATVGGQLITKWKRHMEADDEISFVLNSCWNAYKKLLLDIASSAVNCWDPSAVVAILPIYNSFCRHSRYIQIICLFHGKYGDGEPFSYRLQTGVLSLWDECLAHSSPL